MHYLKSYQYQNYTGTVGKTGENKQNSKHVLNFKKRKT